MGQSQGKEGKDGHERSAQPGAWRGTLQLCQELPAGFNLSIQDHGRDGLSAVLGAARGREKSLCGQGGVFVEGEKEDIYCSSGVDTLNCLSHSSNCKENEYSLFFFPPF